MTQFRNAQLDRPGARVPVALAVAVALVDTLGGSFAGRRSAQCLGFQRHQAFGGEADHLAKETGVGALLQQRAKGDPVIGHRGGPRVRVAVRTSTLPRAAAVITAVDKRPAGATARVWRRRATYPQILHHVWGHDPSFLSHDPLVIMVTRRRTGFSLQTNSPPATPGLAIFRVDHIKKLSDGGETF